MSLLCYSYLFTNIPHKAYQSQINWTMKEILKEIRKYLSKEEREQIAKDLGYSKYTVEAVAFGIRWNLKIFTKLKEEAKKNADILLKPIEPEKPNKP